MTEADEGEWIVVRNWEKFQHYKDRTPPWIKVYTSELLHSAEYRSLTLATRGLLHGLWAHYALARGVVPASVEQLSSVLGATAYQRQLVSLNHAGFIDLSASKPLALARSQEEDPYGSSKNARAKSGARGEKKNGENGARQNGQRHFSPEEQKQYDAYVAEQIAKRVVPPDAYLPDEED